VAGETSDQLRASPAEQAFSALNSARISFCVALPYCRRRAPAAPTQLL